MADPRLSSVPLDASHTKQEFRRAREGLLDARGTATLAAERLEVPGDNPKTFLHDPEQPARAGSPFLLLDKHSAHPLRVGLNTIGRLPDNDVVVSDAYVSRRHCAILVHAEDSCELHDVASKNGTFLNGSRLTQPQPLRLGDEIRMCDRQFILAAQDNVEATGNPPDSGQTHRE